jgi:hypothetical protein
MTAAGGQRPAADARFLCARCGKEAGSVQLFGDRARASIERRSFTSRMSAVVPAKTFDRLHAAIAAADARELHALDLEYAPFYCPKCDASYCGEHWKRWSVYDDDGWHDSIRGSCPDGHERMLED